MKFCLEGEIGGKASLAQVPHAARAVTGGSGVNGCTKRTLDTKNMFYVLVIRHGHETIADLWRLFVLLLLGQQIYE